MLTEEQATYAITNQLQLFDTYPTTSPSFPLHFIHNMLQNLSAHAYYQDVMFVSGFVDLFPIRNLYITSQTLGTYNSASGNGEWGIYEKLPSKCGLYIQMIYDQNGIRN